MACIRWVGYVSHLCAESIFVKGGGFENGNQLVRCKRDELAFLVALEGEPEEQEVVDFNTGFQGGNLDFQYCVWGLFCDNVLEVFHEDSEVLRIGDNIHAEGESPPTGFDSGDKYCAWCCPDGH